MPNAQESLAGLTWLYAAQLVRKGTFSIHAVWVLIRAAGVLLRQKVLSAFRINIEKANTKGENKMKKNKMIGLCLVASALALVGVCASAQGDILASYVGKAMWYLPYAVLVVGIRRLARA